MQRTPSQLYYNGSSNGTAACNVKDQMPLYENCYYGSQAQQYQNRHNPISNTFWNGFQTQMQAPPPSPYFTITQLNYQPMGYNYPNQPTAPYRPPLNNNYTGDNNGCTYIVNPSSKNYQSDDVSLPQDGINIKSNAFKGVPNNTDFMPNYTNLTIMNKVPDYYQPNMDLGNKPIFENLADADPETITKFLVDTCIRAESIAGRNQYRPCFKNIQNLCSKTRLDILKPRNTVANIHSQGIPWVTKDFICAFIRLVNTWYTLKGYLDEPNGNLGKIDSALMPEFKKCYYEWENLNKKMIGHLANIFVNLDNGITVQNAKIYSSFNETFTPKTSAENLKPTNTVVFSTSINREESTKTSNVKTVLSRNKGLTPKQKISNLRGILRLKEIFNSDDDSNSDDSVHTDKDCKQNQQYVDSATFVQKNEMKPQANSISDRTTISTIDSNASEQDLRDSESLIQTNESIWQNAVDKISPFMENHMDAPNNFISNIIGSCNDNLTTEHTYGASIDIHGKEDLKNQNSSFTYFNRNCYNNEPTPDSPFSSGKNKESGLSASSKEKFEIIINVLLDSKFVKYITAVANNDKISEDYKYINKPFYLYKIKESVTQNKYIRPEQVVHDMKSIVNEAKYYNKELKDLWLDKITAGFSRELEFQLTEKFPTSDFSDISGESPQPSLYAHRGTSLI